MEDPASPPPTGTSSHQHSLRSAVGKAQGSGERQRALLKGVVERGRGAPSPEVAQGVGKVEDWQQVPEPELGVGLGHGAWVMRWPGSLSVVYTDHLPGSGLLPIQPV